MSFPCPQTSIDLSDMADLKSVNLFLDRLDTIHDTERLLDHSRGPLTAEAALAAHVCIARGLMLCSELNVGHAATTQFFWSASIELRDHVLSRKDSIGKFIVSPIALIRGGLDRNIVQGLY